MLKLLHRALDLFRSERNSNEVQERRLSRHPKRKTIRGIVTTFCTDYGWINESIFFHTDVVTGNIPVTCGTKVFARVEEVEHSDELKVIEVKGEPDLFEDIERSEIETRFMIRNVTSVTESRFYISKDTWFPIIILSGGFVPYEGDFLLIEYSRPAGSLNTYAHNIRFLNTVHMRKVRIRSIEGRIGKMDNFVFFHLDYIKLPSEYIPQVNDVVNVEAVDSSQFQYSWRAFSMTPVRTYYDPNF